MNPTDRTPQSDRLMPIEVALDGHLTVAALTAALHPVRDRVSLSPGGVRLLFDCRTMRGYDREARQLFVDWHRECSARVVRIAVVTENPLWPLVVSAMALASHREMKAFSNKEAAMRWLGAEAHQ